MFCKLSLGTKNYQYPSKILWVVTSLRHCWLTWKPAKLLLFWSISQKIPVLVVTLCVFNIHRQHSLRWSHNIIGWFFMYVQVDLFFKMSSFAAFIQRVLLNDERVYLCWNIKRLEKYTQFDMILCQCHYMTLKVCRVTFFQIFSRYLLNRVRFWIL
jgi:hypothetical protein